MGHMTLRILTALLAIPLVLGVTFWPQPIAFHLLVLAGLLLALLEYLRMAKGKGMRPLQVEGCLALVFVLLPWFLKPLVSWDSWAGFLAGLLLLSLSFLWSNRPLKDMAASVSVTFFGAVYFGVFGSYFFRLREWPQGAWLLVWLFAATWAYDIGAYFAGTWWGSRKLAPQASPHKTWEGCWGGWLLCLGALFALWKTASPYASLFSLTDILALSVLLSFFGQVGDLVESLLKRSFSTKDSGSFFPGHGGIFDRIDSLLFNAPVLFYYLILFKHSL